MTTIEAIDPLTMLDLSESAAVRDVAQDADARLRYALTNLAGQGTTPVPGS